jgi:hypothetical protein
LIKGDAALNGQTGTLYTYVLSSGERIQRFAPDSLSGYICEAWPLVRKVGGTWFSAYTHCQDGLIIHSLPSGNPMLVEGYDTP